MAKGMFTGVGLSNYFSAGKADWVNARRIINGTDKASEFAARAQKIANA
jgi:putative chitinase